MSTWWDRFGQRWASNGLVDDPTNAQSDAGYAFLGQAPPTVELFNSNMQWLDDKDNWLYGQIGNVIASENMLPSETDLTQLLKAIDGKQKLRLTTTGYWYVDAINGDDNLGDGTQAKPWKRIQKAINFIVTDVEQAGFNACIMLRPGTYEGFNHTVAGNGYVCIFGDPLNARSYLIKNTNGICAYATNSAYLALQGVSLEATGGDTDYQPQGTAIYADRSAVILYDRIHFGPCSNVHMVSAAGGMVFPWLGAGTQYTIYGGARIHMLAAWSGVTTVVSSVITIQNNPLFSDQFAAATASGGIQAWLATYTGTSRGRKYWVGLGGYINTNSGANPNFFPGDVAGARDTATFGNYL